MPSWSIGLDEVMAQARLLHEDRKATLKLLAEGRHLRPKRQPKE